MTSRFIRPDPAQQQLIAGGINLLTRWNASNQPDPNGQPKACVAPYQWFEQDQLGSPTDGSPQPAVCTNGSCTSSSYYAAAGCDGTNPTTLKYFCPQHSGPQQRVGPHLAVSAGSYLVPDGMYAVHNTNYVRALYALGYKGYTWQFDDGVGFAELPVERRDRRSATVHELHDYSLLERRRQQACPRII